MDNVLPVRLVFDLYDSSHRGKMPPDDVETCFCEITGKSAELSTEGEK